MAKTKKKKLKQGKNKKSLDDKKIQLFYTDKQRPDYNGHF